MQTEGTLHIVAEHRTGHVQSTDCWCEPSRIYLAVVRGMPGVTLVVEHNDEQRDNHLLILSRRERDRLNPTTDYRADDNWITRALTPPPLLPPHDPNPRSF